MSRVFLDSGIFIAFLNRRDRYHVSATALFGNPPAYWSTSALVRAETYSWFLHKHSEDAARTFRRLLEQLDGLQVFETSTEHHRKTCHVLDRLRGTKLTYVDASSLALLDAHGIGQVWATDHHLGLTGALVLPRG